MQLQTWEPYLQRHPDQHLAAFLRQGFTSGFRIRFKRDQPYNQLTKNLSSVNVNPSVVDSYIAEEVAMGKLHQATPQAITEGIHISPIGIIPKRNQPGKFRLIVDLSSLQGFSMNDGIDSHLCTLKYTSVTQAANMVKQLGQVALMAKLELKSAYRMIPADQPLLGIKWRGVIYLDQALPFGLRSAPKIFSAVADGLAWVLHCEGIQHQLHYLDDFFCEPPASTSCKDALNSSINHLGLPVAPNKVEGPTTCLTFLGIKIDSEKQQLCLPREKLIGLKDLIVAWQSRHAATKHQLQELLGHLNSAASMVRPGRSFMRSIIDTMKIPRHPHHFVHLNQQCKVDLAWWATFLSSWNGTSFFAPDSIGTSVISDASGWGCGAFNTSTGAWFQLEWPASWTTVSIAVKEMIPVIIATALWGSLWSQYRVNILSDNTSVDSVITSRTSKDSPHMAHLLRCLFFFKAHYDCELTSDHILGKLNKAADALSWNQVSSFFSYFPQAQQSPVPVPQTLSSLLMDPTLTWTSPRWGRLFRSTLDLV